MTEEEFKRLRKHDWVETITGLRGTIEHFGRWNGKRTVRASRQNADSVWIDVPDCVQGYVHRSCLARYLPAPLLTPHEAAKAKYEK